MWQKLPTASKLKHTEQVWRKWQTRRTQDPVGVSSCGFDPRHLHQKRKDHINMIIQGTTPTHSFQLPFDTSIIKTARFVYSQEGEVSIVKTGDDVTISQEDVATTLTQEDTYNLTPGVRVKLLLRILTKEGKAVTSDPVWLLCRGCECKEIMQ